MVPGRYRPLPVPFVTNDNTDRPPQRSLGIFAGLAARRAPDLAARPAPRRAARTSACRVGCSLPRAAHLLVSQLAAWNARCRVPGHLLRPALPRGVHVAALMVAQVSALGDLTDNVRGKEHPTRRGRVSRGALRGKMHSTRQGGPPLPRPNHRNSPRWPVKRPRSPQFRSIRTNLEFRSFAWAADCGVRRGACVSCVMACLPAPHGCIDTAAFASTLLCRNATGEGNGGRARPAGGASRHTAPTCGRQSGSDEQGTGLNATDLVCSSDPDWRPAPRSQGRLEDHRPPIQAAPG